MSKLILNLIALFPLRMIHSVGSVLGELVFIVSGSYRRKFLIHMEQAGYNEARLHRVAAREAGKAMMEVLWIWGRPPGEVLSMVDLSEIQDTLIPALLEKSPQQGILFITPHLGSFEVAGRVVAQYTPLTALYQTAKTPFMQSLIEHGRISAGLTIAPANAMGVKMLFKALRRGESVSLLPDQVPGKGEGVWVSHFGRLAYTMILPWRLARATQSLVVLGWAERLPAGQGWRMHGDFIEMPAHVSDAEAAGILNRALEPLIRSAPEQYFWGYNRYKVPAGATRPNEGIGGES